LSRLPTAACAAHGRSRTSAHAQPPSALPPTRQVLGCVRAVWPDEPARPAPRPGPYGASSLPASAHWQQPGVPGGALGTGGRPLRQRQGRAPWPLRGPAPCASPRRPARPRPPAGATPGPPARHPPLPCCAARSDSRSVRRDPAHGSQTREHANLTCRQVLRAAGAAPSAAPSARRGLARRRLAPARPHREVRCCAETPHDSRRAVCGGAPGHKAADGCRGGRCRAAALRQHVCCLLRAVADKVAEPQVHCCLLLADLLAPGAQRLRTHGAARSVVQAPVRVGAEWCPQPHFKHSKIGGGRGAPSWNRRGMPTAAPPSACRCAHAQAGAGRSHAAGRSGACTVRASHCLP